MLCCLLVLPYLLSAAENCAMIFWLPASQTMLDLKCLCKTVECIINGKQQNRSVPFPKFRVHDMVQYVRSLAMATQNVRIHNRPCTWQSALASCIAKVHVCSHEVSPTQKLISTPIALAIIC